jgi:hypothetical protein
MTSETERILEKLGDMELRLQRLESIQSDGQVMSEDRTEIAKEGELESETMTKVNESMVTTKRIAMCDYCFGKIDQLSICKKCGKKLCENCSIDFRNENICLQDLREIHPISRQSFKIILMIANGITGEHDMSRVSGVPTDELKGIIDVLRDSGYLATSFFGGKRLTDTGMEAFYAHSQVLGGKDDMKDLDIRIEEYVSQT